MSNVDLADLVDNGPRLQAVPEGVHQLLVLSAKRYTKKETGVESLIIEADITDEAEGTPLLIYVVIPTPETLGSGDPAVKRDAMEDLEKIRQTVAGFSLPSSSLNNVDMETGLLPEWVGATANAYLRSYVARDGVLRNIIKNFLPS